MRSIPLRWLLPVLSVAVCLAFAATDAPAAADGPISPRLAAAMGGDGAELPVWVFLKDKGLQGADLRQALAEAEAGLSPRALSRRARVLPAGASLVDGRDLPVHPGYLERLTATGARLRRTSRWLNAASVLATPGQIERLAALDCVRRLDPVARGRRLPPPAPFEPIIDPAPAKSSLWTEAYGLSRYQLEQINVPAVHELGLTGEGIVVGMLDTGFRTTHEALAGVTVLDRYDFVMDDPVVDWEDGDPTTSINHGTVTFSTIAGYKPGSLVGPAHGASFLLAKTEDVSVEIPQEEDNWVAGLEWAEAAGADVISSSLGYSDWYVYEDLDGDTAVTTVAGDLAAGRGLVVVTSAGNSRSSLGYVLAPADGDSIIAVGAVDSLGVFTFFSSPGPTADGRIKPDVMTLGLGNPVADPTNDTGYGFSAGTSLSCPLAAGVAALVLQRLPELTPMQVREALRQTADRAATPDNDYGWGTLDAYAAVTYWGPAFQHAFLADTDDEAGPYAVAAAVACRSGLAPGSAVLRYRIDGGPWQELPLVPTGSGDDHTAAIPGQPLGTQVEYYLEATGLDGFTTAWPLAGSAAPAAFEVTGLEVVQVGVTVGQPVPDAGPAGLQSVITVAGGLAGTIVSVAVDIGLTHPDVSELVVELTGPDGTAVRLHDRSGAGIADLVGTWPLDLAVDGPGSLAGFVGTDSTGDWTLRIVDEVAGQAGVLDSWGLTVVLKDFVTAGDPPRADLPVLHPNVPNPFNPGTVLSFDLPRPGRVRLSIYDLRGMLVRTLVDGDLEAGPHTRTWDGTDQAGREAGSGAYLYRLESRGLSLERKMLLLR